MAKTKKEESTGFWMVTFDDGSAEIFESRKAAKKALKDYAKVPDEGRGVFPMYLHGPIVHLEVRPSKFVEWSIIQEGKGFDEEDLVP